jgi:alpha-ribazole phosphatase
MRGLAPRIHVLLFCGAEKKNVDARGKHGHDEKRKDVRRKKPERIPVMAVTTRWWWVRHAPVINGRPELYGHKDLDCTLEDEAGIAQLAAWLPADAVWVTSHLKRAICTAEAVRQKMPARSADLQAPIVDPAFAEQNFGDWEGLSFDELRAWLGDGFDTFWKAPAKVAAPRGESFADVIERVAGGIARVTAAHAGRDIVAVAHGGSIRAALAHALSLDPDAALTFRIDNLSLTVIEHMRPSTDKPERGARTTWRVAAVNSGLRNGVKEW